MPRERRYPSDTTDVQWAIVEPLLPPPTNHPRGGRKEKHPRRDIVDAILYVVRTSCSWRQLPADFPPWGTVYWYFARGEADGTTEPVHDALREQVRLAAGRQAEPTAGVIDSQSVKGADTVGHDSRGYDAGKKINGRKRFIVTDTLGLLITVMVCAASVQDRDGAKSILLDLYYKAPGLRCVFADGGFAGKLVDWAARILRMVIEVVRKPDGQRGFEVLPRRWVVERTFGWLMGYRRLVRDYERLPEHSESMIRWAMINTMSARLARGKPATRPGRRPLRYTA